MEGSGIGMAATSSISNRAILHSTDRFIEANRRPFKVLGWCRYGDDILLIHTMHDTLLQRFLDALTHASSPYKILLGNDSYDSIENLNLVIKRTESGRTDVKNIAVAPLQKLKQNYHLARIVHMPGPCIDIGHPPD